MSNEEDHRSHHQEPKDTAVFASECKDDKDGKHDEQIAWNRQEWHISAWCAKHK